jgi:Peptidase family S49 N-terminal/Peptidase family S49
MELPKNTGVPKLQYIKVTHLNPKYDSYKYSITAQTQSKAIAAAEFRKTAWQRAWGKALVSSSSSSGGGVDAPESTTSTALTPFQIQGLIQLEQDFLKNASTKQQEIQAIVTALQRKNIDESMKKLGMESVYQMDPNVPVPVVSDNATGTNVTTVSTVTKIIPSGGSLRKWKGGRDTNKVSTATLASLQTDLFNLEMKFMDNVIKMVGPQYAATIRTIVLGSENGEGLTQLLLSSNMERPLTRLLAGHSNGGSSSAVGGSDGTSPPSKKIYVTRFPGDLNASQVATLREEITAILQSKPRPNIDEVIVVLQTGGGTVTGYGLAAAQLQRIKNANIHLTIAVEQVAASGGYMMACIADTIVASPFAVLGSIGVISDIPNVYERLKEEGIEFQTITAGK